MADIGLIALSTPNIRTDANVTVRDTPLDKGVLAIPGGDLSTQLIQEIVGGGTQFYYYMRAKETGGGCGSPVFRYWRAQGAPDLLGTYYLGPRCSPAGTLSDFVVLDRQEG